jgi:hypothetical protein
MSTWPERYRSKCWLNPVLTAEPRTLGISGHGLLKFWPKNTEIDSRRNMLTIQFIIAFSSLKFPLAWSDEFHV